MKLVLAEQIRTLENIVIRESGTTVQQLTNDAGLGVARAIREHRGWVAGLKCLVLVGPGHNGEDGMIAASHLHRWGATVFVYDVTNSLSDSDGLKNDEKRTINQLLDPLDISVVGIQDDDKLQKLTSLTHDVDVVIDAVVGIGLSRPIESPLSDILAVVRDAKLGRPLMEIIAIDVPSGLNSDTGEADAATVPTDLTLVLGLPKLGLFSGKESDVSGKRRLVNIEGISSYKGQFDLNMDLLTKTTVRKLLPQRSSDAHKGTHGKAFIIAGSEQYTGASMLAVMGAQRVGSGLVCLAATPGVHFAVTSKIPEATHHRLSENSDGIMPDAISDLLDLRDYKSLLIGCGIGKGKGTGRFVAQFLCERGELNFPYPLPPSVIDADALNILSDLPDWWVSLADNVAGPSIVTPHPGEMARLMNRSVEEIQKDRVRLAKSAAQKWGVIVVLKGSHTVVADPDDRISVSPWAVSGLATAGTGDVLAGTIAGFLSQGMDGFEASVCGVYVHGLAGHIKSMEGSTGFLASDVADTLPRALHEIGVGELPIEW
jgi:hydroxyethylthiazole kinase-like uncharacterized protein yjeF